MPHNRKHWTEVTILHFKKDTKIQNNEDKMVKTKNI
jgi:hypothetical protein